MVTLVRIAAAACLAIMTSVGAAGAESRRYDFTVIWSMFPKLELATGALELEESGSEYRMTMTARANIAIPRIDWRATFSTVGRVTRRGRSPRKFERTSRTQTQSEEAEITFRSGRTPKTRLFQSTPAARGGDWVDPRRVSSRAVDPLTFLARVLDEVVRTDGRSCGVKTLTWDGVRLAEIQAVTTERVRGERVDCRIRYSSIRGLPDVRSFVAKEGQTVRTVRFEKQDGVWEPVYIKISGEFGGFDSTFTTTVTRRE